jgi:enoyl-CoA hydratase/carnithine racemase
VSSILYEKSGPRATITFNRPEVLNAFDHEMLVGLADACEQAANDDDVRVVVLTGAGRAFCVGANLQAWADEGLVGQRARILEVVPRDGSRRHRDP